MCVCGSQKSLPIRKKLNSSCSWPLVFLSYAAKRHDDGVNVAEHIRDVQVGLRVNTIFAATTRQKNLIVSGLAALARKETFELFTPRVQNSSLNTKGCFCKGYRPIFRFQQNLPRLVYKLV